jgi:hypothetical protein
VTLRVWVFALGLVVTDLSFVTLLCIWGFFSSGPRSPIDLALLGSWALMVLMYSFIPTSLLGLIFGAVTAYVMRAVPGQWLHVLAFTGAGLLAGAAFSLVVPEAFPLIGPATALSAGFGRLSVWRLATVTHMGTPAHGEGERPEIR